MIHALNMQEHTRIPWTDTSQRTAGIKPIGPVQGMSPLNPDWGIHSDRFAKALIKTAIKERYSCFGPAWHGNVRDYHTLAGGITAVAVTFYTYDQLEQYYTAVPAARTDEAFQELVSKNQSGNKDLICAVWPTDFVLKHSEGEITQCEYWVSQSHPDNDQAFSLWPEWPARRVGGQAVATNTCALIWDTKQDGPFFSKEHGRPMRGEGAYRIDRVPDDLQTKAIRAAVESPCEH